MTRPKVQVYILVVSGPNHAFQKERKSCWVPTRVFRRAWGTWPVGPSLISFPFSATGSGCRNISANPFGTGSFPPSRTFWLFLTQVLSPNGSCREAVREALAWLYTERQEVASPNTAAYCKARGRLAVKPLETLSRKIAQRLEECVEDHGRWHGRAVKVVDGSTLSMPDSPDNQKRYPQPDGQKPGCGFPVLRLVVVFSLATGAVLASARSSLGTSEWTLFHRLWKHFRPGDVALADRGFSSFANFARLQKRGVDSVMRLHQRRKEGNQRLKRLGRGDWLVSWTKNPRPPQWAQRSFWESLPDTLIIREISITVPIPGFRSRRIVLATTLLDPKKFPKKSFADLYRRRWYAELFLRDIKTTMGMDILRCKSPNMIHRELAMYLIAYNLIRCLMVEAARHADLPVERISFTGTVVTIRSWRHLLTQNRTDPARTQTIFKLILWYIARDVLPHRPNRIEPRARKRRPKPYPLLNKPRSVFNDVPHRNRYRKALS